MEMDLDGGSLMGLMLMRRKSGLSIGDVGPQTRRHRASTSPNNSLVLTQQ
jgi:hypothetical protein